MSKLYSFHWDCGRMGELDGLFIAHQEDVEKLIGEEIYFGEVLGKHSEIFGILEEKHLTIKTDDQAFIIKLREIIGKDTISGFNPFDYYEQE